eukprot:724388-Prorocentrum_minimum.AAC.2
MCDSYPFGNRAPLWPVSTRRTSPALRFESDFAGTFRARTTPAQPSPSARSGQRVKGSKGRGPFGWSPFAMSVGTLLQACGPKTLSEQYY